MTTMRALQQRIKAAEKSIRRYTSEINFDQKKMRRVMSSPVTLLATFSAGFLGTFLLIGKLRARKAAIMEAETIETKKAEHAAKEKPWIPYLIEVASLGLGALRVGKSLTRRHE